MQDARVPFLHFMHCNLTGRADGSLGASVVFMEKYQSEQIYAHQMS